MKRVYVEVSCDNCGQADHYVRPHVDEQAQDNGWLVVGRKHFCDDVCQTSYLINRPAPKSDEVSNE